jgi:3D-(3,5/4)-trihydroxycyclohexane-1,2-dione acylhydrolase (decyclizing)
MTYHVECGYSAGYEVRPRSGSSSPTRPARSSRCSATAATDRPAVQERIKVIVVLVQNHGFHSIGSLSESLGQRFGTRYRMHGSPRTAVGEFSLDLANARSLGCHVIEVHTQDELEAAIAEARAWPQDGGPVVIHVETTPFIHAPDSDSWWDVPVSEVSDLRSTKTAYKTYLEHKKTQQALVTPTRGPAQRRGGGRRR